MSDKTIAFIGAGNMTRAIITGLINNQFPKDKIIASNRSPEKLDALRDEFGVRTTINNNEAIAAAEVIVLAVKPQLMADVIDDFDGHQPDTQQTEKLFISIAAGINVARLQQMLGFTAPVVRVMPNTPCAIGKGMSGIYASEQVSEADKTLADFLMQQTGETIWVAEESMIDGVIAAAGSSPAYFFLFLEAMQNKAVQLGFASEDARKMVQQAMLGAAEMVCHNPQLELSQLRAQVTSKGGTTAQAIAKFEQHKLPETVAEAMQAAVDRANEMSDLF